MATILEQLKSLKAENETLQAAVASLTKQVDQFKAGNESAIAEAVAAAQADIEKFKGIAETLTDANAELKARVKDSDETISAQMDKISKLSEEETSASKKAASIAAAAGIKPVEKDGSKHTEDELESVRAQMRTETDPTKRGILARRARELRGDGNLFKNN